jgi:hypothetical protein
VSVRVSLEFPRLGIEPDLRSAYERASDFILEAFQFSRFQPDQMKTLKPKISRYKDGVQVTWINPFMQ